MKRVRIRLRPALVVAGVGLIAAGAAILIGAQREPLVSVAAALRARFPSLAQPAALTGLALEALILGTLALLAAWLIVPRRAQLERLVAARPGVLIGAAVMLLIVLWLPIILWGRSTVIDGTRYWWLDDDALISMRYARNLANGAGLVWNPGERVEGYTNFLWTLVMAGVHALPIDLPHTSLVVLLISLALSAATLPWVARLTRLLGGAAGAVAVALLAFVLNDNIAAWNTTGGETALLGLLLTVGVCRVLEEARTRRPRAATYLLLGAVALVRADGLVLAGLAAGAALLLTADRRRVLAFSLLMLSLPLAHEIWRIMYYGDVLPNTAYLKVLNWDRRLSAGVQDGLKFALGYGPWLLAAAIGAARPRSSERLAVLGIAVGQLAWVVFIGGDAFPGNRFLVPVLPLVLAAGLTGWEQIADRMTLRAAGLIAGLALLPLMVPGYFNVFVSGGGYNADNLRVGLWLRAHYPPEAVVADAAAGSVPYFSGLGAVDLLGKSDPVIAREAAVAGNTRPGHNKYDYEYSLGVRRPDLVVLPYRGPVSEAALQPLKTGEASWVADLYLSPIVQQHCLGHVVHTSALRAVVSCDWSRYFERGP